MYVLYCGRCAMGVGSKDSTVSVYVAEARRWPSLYSLALPLPFQWTDRYGPTPDTDTTLINMLLLFQYVHTYTVAYIHQMWHPSFAVGPAARSDWRAMRYSTIHLLSNTLNHNPPTVSFFICTNAKCKVVHNLINLNVFFAQSEHNVQ